MSAKPPPLPPAPRFYLATPPLTEAVQLADTIGALLAEADIAAVLVRLADADHRTKVNRIKALAPVIQNAGAALLLDGHVELVARTGADGAHVNGVEALKEALDALKPERIVGVGALYSRHDSMVAGESGADYVLFGEPQADGDPPAPETTAERLDWWAELFEPPCVGYARTLDEAELFAASGADFVMLGDLLWVDPRGPQAALAEAAERLKRGYAARVARIATRQG